MGGRMMALDGAVEGYERIVDRDTMHKILSTNKILG
jgi:hypothetical protein